MANLTAKFRLIDEMSAKLDNIAQSGRNALSQWERAGGAIDTAFGGAVDNTVHVAQSLNSTSDSIEDLASATSKAENAVDELSQANKETEDALEGVSTDADKASEKVKDYGEESEDAGRKSEEFGKKSSEALKSIEDLLVTAGIVKALEAIGEAFIGCVEDAIEFESAITGVYKTVDGTPEQLAAIADEVKELSLNIPSTTTEIAAVAEAAGQLGIATEDVMGFTEVMINLGESTNLSSDEAASSLAKFANITKMSADNYENLGSTVVALGNNFATTEADIVAMSTRMASAGTLAGLSEPEILALAAAVSSVGIEADAGGSSMSTLLSKMQLAVETGSDELEQFASVANMTSEEFQKQWGESAVDALYAFIAGLNDTERNGASATAILDEMGITEIRLSNAVKSLASNHAGLGDAIDLANNAWVQNTALATEANTRYSTLESKLAMTENAQNNLSTAIGEVFAPAVSAGADVLTGLLNGLTGFVKEHPIVVKAVAAITAGVAAFTAGIVAFTVAKKVATVAQAAFNAVAYANPYVLLATAIVAVTAGLAVFIASMADANDETKGMTATTREQYYELQNLEAEYETACETYGETSEEASRLRYEMDDLEASFEANRQTVEEFTAECDDLVAKGNEITSSYYEATEKIEDQRLGTFALIQKLEDLANQNVKTVATEELMKDIIEELNDQLPGLSLSYEELSKNAAGYVEKMKEAANIEADEKKQEAQIEAYENALIQREKLTKQIAEAEANLNAERERRGMYYDEYIGGYANDFYTEDSLWASWTTDLDEYKEALDELYAQEEENNKIINETEEAWQAAEEAAKAAAEAPVSYEDAVTSSLSNVQGEIKALCEAYDEAYETARESIDGQIGLFDEIVLEVEQSTAEMMGAWESQIQYLTSYTENIKKAMDFGLDEALVEELSDGSQESAAQLDTIISKVEELGGTTEEAKKFVDDFNAKFQEVESAKDEFAGTVADMETDFTDKMLEIESQLNSSIDKMNMETDAAAAAKATMSAYIQEIIAGGNSAVSAAESAAKRVAAALAQAEADANAADNITYVPRDFVGPLAPGQQYAPYASGTAYASQGVHLVGEHGPELVEFGGGETVYPADETSRILARTADAQFRTSEATAATVKEERTDDKGDSKTIRLEINGSGAIEVDSSMDEETVVGILAAHLKPVLAGIVKQEIYEEGDLSYDF